MLSHYNTLDELITVCIRCHCQTQSKIEEVPLPSGGGGLIFRNEWTGELMREHLR